MCYVKMFELCKWYADIKSLRTAELRYYTQDCWFKLIKQIFNTINH